VDLLAAALKEKIPNLIVLTGGKRTKESKQLLEKVAAAPEYNGTRKLEEELKFYREPGKIRKQEMEVHDNEESSIQCKIQS
jgi:hypothetical protein